MNMNVYVCTIPLLQFLCIVFLSQQMAQHHYATRSKSPRSNDTDSTAPQLLRATSPRNVGVLHCAARPRYVKPVAFRDELEMRDVGTTAKRSTAPPPLLLCTRTAEICLALEKTPMKSKAIPEPVPALSIQPSKAWVTRR